MSSLKYFLNRKLIRKEVGGEMVFLPPDSEGLDDSASEIFILNRTGRAVVEILLEGKAGFEEIFAAFQEKYDINPGQLRQDLKDFLGELKAHCIIVQG